MAIVLALSAAVAYGSADFVGGLASRRTAPVAVALGAQLGGLVLLLAALPTLGGGGPELHELGFGAIAGVFGAIGLVLLYRSLALGPMSVVAPTTALSASLVPILAGLVAGERPGPVTFVGIAVSLVAVTLITREPNRILPAVSGRATAGRATASGATASGATASGATASGATEGGAVTGGPVAPSITAVGGRRVVGLALAAGSIFGLFFVFLHHAGPDAGLWPLVGARLVSVPLLFVLARRQAVAREWTTAETLRSVLVSGALDMAANILYLLAVQHGMLTVVAAVIGLYPAATVLLAQVHLDERLARPQLAGLGSAGVAALLIALA